MLDLRLKMFKNDRLRRSCAASTSSILHLQSHISHSPHIPLPTFAPARYLYSYGNLRSRLRAEWGLWSAARTAAERTSNAHDQLGAANVWDFPAANVHGFVSPRCRLGDQLRFALCRCSSASLALLSTADLWISARPR